MMRGGGGAVGLFSYRAAQRSSAAAHRRSKAGQTLSCAAAPDILSGDHPRSWGEFVGQQDAQLRGDDRGAQRSARAGREHVAEELAAELPA
jgi:hypothetical protein